MTSAIIPAAGSTRADFEFLTGLFGRPTASDQAKVDELAAALTAKHDAIQAIYASEGSLADHLDRIERVRTEYAARVREIEQRYAQEAVLDLTVQSLGGGAFRVAA